MAEALPTTSTMGIPLAEVRRILSTALRSASESPAIIEEIHGFILDCFKDSNIIQHYDHNPDRHDAIVAACTIRKSLYTPAATPRGSTVPPQTPPQRITQEFESGQGSAAQHTTPIPTSNPQGEDSLSELSEGLEGGGQPHQAHHEAAEEPIPEQTGDSLPLTTPEDGVLSGINGGPDHAPAQREGRPSRQAAQVAATLISQQLDTPNCRPPKRKYVPEASEAPSSALTTASGDTVSGTPEQGPDVNYSSSPSPNVNSQDRQLDLLRSDQGSIPTSPAPASLSRPEGASNPATSTREGPPQSHDVLPAEFANLSEELRAAGTMVGSKESVEHLWHIFDHMRVAGTSRAGITRLDPLVESSPTSISDERIRVLGTYLTREEQNQSHLRGAKALSVLRGRLILVELIDNYLVEHEAWKAWTSGNDDNDENDENEENAVTGSKRRKTEAPRCPLDRYTDILYPDTKGWDVARPSDTIASKASRKQVKAKLNYRIRIGKPLVMMARQNGMAVLGVLSKKMTERVLHAIGADEVDIFVKYIAVLNPDLKERLRNASELLPGMVMGRLPPGVLVLQTYTVDRMCELHDRSLNELFQFATSEEIRPIDTVVGTGADEMNTFGSSSLPTVGPRADDESAVDAELPPQRRPPERTGRQPGTDELLELHTAGSPIINIRSWELPSMDRMESITARSSRAEPLSEMPVREEFLTDVTPEDTSMDMELYDPSQSAFPTLLPGTLLMPTVEPGLGTNDVTWHPNGADGRFHHPVPFSNLDNVYLSSPLVSPSLPPSPRMTADDTSSQDVPFTYSSLFFEGVS